jgi:uncharacterized protein (TIGR03437 family)
VVSQINPIKLGEIIIIYLTGLGIYTPGAQTGVPATGPAQIEFTPTVTLGSSNCTVLYAGPTPGFVGLYQINCGVSSQPVTGSMPFAPLQVIVPNQQIEPPDPNVNNSNSVLVWINL